jgi:exopolyphosphatase/guanosine-5'-triphosphate,3'-diphosphate pyrophosphatase
VVVGLGGTVRTLASIYLKSHPGERRHRHGLRLGQADVTAIRERLERVSRRKRRTFRGLRAERSDIIVAGAVVIEEVLVFGGYRALVVCTRGVRDGLLLHETFAGRRNGRG